MAEHYWCICKCIYLCDKGLNEDGIPPVFKRSKPNDVITYAWGLFQKQPAFLVSR